ncbi:MAG: DUF962 domain-containing protein [Alphaproteobacteria bacterium]|nr:DUF962 domain-containing protein [Alphaproteobacteria bacterium]
MSDRIKSYKEFWPYYLSEHRKPATRNMHIAGTLGGVAVGVAAVASGFGLLALGGVAVAYGAAWTAHAFIEKNTPATFKYPLWSLVSDFKMVGHWATGTLQKEVDKHLGAQPEARTASRPAAKPQGPKRSLGKKMKGLSSRFTQAVKRAMPGGKEQKPANAQKPQPKPGV